jgi:hypothetical protein
MQVCPLELVFDVCYHFLARSLALEHQVESLGTIGRVDCRTEPDGEHFFGVGGGNRVSRVGVTCIAIVDFRQQRGVDRPAIVYVQGIVAENVIFLDNNRQVIQ